MNNKPSLISEDMIDNIISEKNVLVYETPSNTVNSSNFQSFNNFSQKAIDPYRKNRNIITKTLLTHYTISLYLLSRNHYIHARCGGLSKKTILFLQHAKEIHQGTV